MNTLKQQTLLNLINAGNYPLDLFEISDIKQQSFNAKKYIGFDDHINTNYACTVHYPFSNGQIISISFKSYQEKYDFDDLILATIKNVHKKSYLELLSDNVNNVKNIINVLIQLAQSEMLDCSTVAKHTKGFSNSLRYYIWNNRHNLESIL